VTRNLTVHFKRSAYLVTASPATLPLGGKPVRVHEWEDGRVEIYCNGQALPFTVFDEAAHQVRASQGWSPRARLLTRTPKRTFLLGREPDISTWR
jgi:hypothetical protein